MPPLRPSVLCGVVVSAGKMMKAVKVRTAKQTYNAFLRKHFRTFQSHLVSDPTSSLRTGDIVRITTGWATSRRIKHVVTEIVAPYGPAITERPPIMSEEERLAHRQAKRDVKHARRMERKERARSGGIEEEEVGEEGEGEGKGESPNETSGRLVGVTMRREAVAEEQLREAERVQGELDGKGVGMQDVRRRLEGIRL